jgi:hypothetical protein
MTQSPYAPPPVAGLNNASPAGFTDVDFTYVYDVTMPAAPAAGSTLRDQQQPIDQDSDFALRGISYVGVIPGAFNVRFQDAQGFYLSSGMVSNGNLSANAASPTPVFPELILPAGSRIGIDIDNVAGAPIQVQIAFRGVKRYRVRG